MLFRSRKKKIRKPVRRAFAGKKSIKSILIIDDEKDLCLLLGDALSSRGYQVRLAHTRKEAMLSVKEQAPDMVFCDLKLPDGDGLKILSKIRAISPRTVVSMITAYGSEEARDKAKKLGAYSFIDKPFIEEDILKSIKEISRRG